MNTGLRRSSRPCGSLLTRFHIFSVSFPWSRSGLPVWVSAPVNGGYWPECVIRSSNTPWGAGGNRMSVLSSAVRHSWVWQSGWRTGTAGKRLRGPVLFRSRVRATTTSGRRVSRGTRLWAWQRRARLSFTAGGVVTVAGARSFCSVTSGSIGSIITTGSISSMGNTNAEIFYFSY